MWFRELDFSGQSISLVLGEVKGMHALEIARPGFAMHFAQGCRHVVQRVYERVLAIDFNVYINAGRHQRTARRRSWRNGTRKRSLQTAVGILELTVPRDRAGGFQPELFARYRRVESGLTQVIREMFVRGISTRRVGEVLEALCGAGVSASTVPAVTRELDQAVRDFANAPLGDDYVFLFLDAITVWVRFGLKAKRVLVLVVYGIQADGGRAILGFQRVNSESTACCSMSWRTLGFGATGPPIEADRDGWRLRIVGGRGRNLPLGCASAVLGA